MEESPADIQHHIVYHKLCFSNFASIYCFKHSSQSFQFFVTWLLLENVQIVHQIYLMEYGVQFRMKKLIDPSLCWGSVDADLWLWPVVQNNISTSTKRHKCYSGVCKKQNCRFLHE